MPTRTCVRLLAVLSLVAASSLWWGAPVAADEPQRRSADRNTDTEAVPPEGAEGIQRGGNLSLSRPAGTSGAGFAWKGTEETFKVPQVRCPEPGGAVAGRLDFLFRPYCDTGFNPDAGGAALEGGFTSNGVDPCAPAIQKPGTEYVWIQTIVTNRPLGGRGPGEYVDSRDPIRDPRYPFGSNDANNPNGDPFTRSFYDGPQRAEEAAANISWLAELMLVCRNDHKINVLGSFLWGFDITADGNANDGNVDVTGTSPCCWGPATDSAINTVAREARGTRTRQGWAVHGHGCCCYPLALHDGDAEGLDDGMTRVLVLNDVPGEVFTDIVIFPRNRPVVSIDFPQPPGWQIVMWSGGNMAPPLPYQQEGFEMFENGIWLINVERTPGPDAYQFLFQTAGHESFFDVYVNSQMLNQWVPYVVRTQQLLGDMDGDLQITPVDLEVWDLAFNDPVGYQDTFNLDPEWAGDLNHNDVLDPPDRDLLAEIVFFDQDTDANGPEQEGGIPGDFDGDGDVDIVDFSTFAGCFSGSGNPATDECLIADLDGDGDVDIVDFSTFSGNYTGSL